jgi:predicted permease
LATPICAEAVLRGENVRLDKKDSWWLGAVGRLKPGWTVESAAAYFRAQSDNILKANIPPTYNSDAVTNYLKYRFAAFDAGKGISSLRGRYSTPLQLLLAIAGLVLLIACANLANLMLARASAREREIAVRLAIGASRPRLVRQLLSESLLLALTGALLGAGLAQVLSQTLVSFLSTRDSPAFVDLHFDWRVLGFAAALAILTCTLFGLTPALRATRGQPSSAMRVGGRGLTSSRERLGLRRGLVVLQVGLSLVLLVGALLFVRSFSKLANLDAGFRQEGLLVTSLDFSPLSLPRERRLPFADDLLQRVRAVPGVDSAAITGVVPLTNNNWNQNLKPDSESEKTDRNTHISNVSPGYFQTMAIPLVAGRDFDARDSAGAPKAAIVNEIFVRQFLKPGNPIGKTFQLQRPPGQPEPVYTIVGMVKDTKYSDLHDEIEPIAFVPVSQDEKPDQYAQIMVRSNAELVGLVSSLKRVLAEVNPSIVVDFQVFRTQVRESLLRERLMATLSGFFGGLAVLLAVIGLYGVMSYIVVRRRSEIGIRIALGASRPEVIRMIMQEAGWLLAVGIVVGTGLALALGRTAESLLFGLKPNDPATIAFSIAALAAVAAAASYLPALRAAAVEPMTALREE